MLTVVESPIFQRLWPRYWDEEGRAEFASFIAVNPDSGAVIRGSGGVRKVRWSREGAGKSGGVRIVYLTKNEAAGGLPSHHVRKVEVREYFPRHSQGDPSCPRSLKS